MEPTKLEKVIAKIQALRNISKSTHSKMEAETTMALAAKLIAEYQLSEAELQASTQEVEDIDLKNEYIIYETGRSTPWKAEMVWGLAELNNVFAIVSPIRDSFTHRRGSRYRVIGRKSDCQIAVYMFGYLATIIQNLADAEFAFGRKRGVNPEKESWCLGCVRGFLSKMKLESKKVLATGSSQAMVLVSNKVDEAKEAYRQQLADRAGKDVEKIKFGTVAPSKAQRDHDAMVRGFEKGKTITVNVGLDAGNIKDIKKLGQ